MADETAPVVELPQGHPQSAYVGPDLSHAEGIGTLPDEEQQARDDLIAAQEAEVKAAQEHEAAVAAAEAEAAAAEAGEARPKAEPKSKESAASSSKSS